MIQKFRERLAGENERHYSLLKAQFEGDQLEEIKNEKDKTQIHEDPIVRFKRNFDCLEDPE